MAEKPKTNTEPRPAAVFTKEQLAASKKYANRRDLINALLEPGQTYTLDQVEALIEKTMKGTVR